MELQVKGTKSKGRGRKTWKKCVKEDMKRLGSNNDDAHNREKWKNLTTGNLETLPLCGNEDVIRYGVRSCDVKR